MESIEHWATDPKAKAVAEALAAYGEGLTVITVEEVMAGIEKRGGYQLRRDVTLNLRALNRMGYGRLIAGRGPVKKSRFTSPYEIKRLGQAALGLTDIPPPATQEIQGIPPPAQNQHRIVVRPGVTIQLPGDLTPAEAARLARIIETLASQ